MAESSRNPQDWLDDAQAQIGEVNTQDNAAVFALIGIGYALIEIAERLGSDDDPQKVER